VENQVPEIRAIVVYYTRMGVVRTMAQHVAEGVARVPNARATMLEIDDRPVDIPREGESEEDARRRRATVVNQLAISDVLFLGSPSYFGSMASPLKRLFEECSTASIPAISDRSRPWRNNLFHGKLGAAFTASATPHGGNEQTLHSMLTMLMHLGVIVVTPGQQLPILENEAAPYGPTTVTGPDGDRPPTEQELEDARRLGEQVAQTALQFKLGRAEWERLRAASRPQSPPTASPDS
jgi:NAD(P)H dehydrogenase (quinone)